MCKAPVMSGILLFLSVSLYAADVLTGDENAADGQTFSFQVQQHALGQSADIQGMNFYVAAHPGAGGAGVANEFAVSRVSRDSSAFVGLATQQAKVNLSNVQSANPLYDQGIAFLSLFDGSNSILSGMPERPVVVTNADRKTIYMINNYFEIKNDKGALEKTTHVLSASASTQNIPDAVGLVTAGIVQLQAAAPHIFAIVRPSSGGFGEVGSGIAMIIVGSLPLANNISFTGPFIIDAPTGASTPGVIKRALPLDVTSSVLKIGSNLDGITDVVDVCWHPIVNRLYVALQVTGGSQATDGARALVVGRVGENKELILDAIAPEVVFDGALDKIVGAKGADVQVSIHKVRPLFSSTALPYLVVVGGVGAPASTKRTVYALPLVGSALNKQLVGNEEKIILDESVWGTVAAKNVDPTDFFTPTLVPLFQQRMITQAATTAAHMPLSSDAATQVGGGSILNGDITDLFVQKDTVFASVESADATQTSGIFYSQAVFDATGKIKTWTTWRRAAGTLDHVLGSALDPITGKQYFLAENSSGNVQVVKRTAWQNGALNGLGSMISSIESLFDKEEAGVQGLHDFVITSTALDTQTPGLLDISLLIATGYQKLFLVETSNIVSGAVVPHGGADFGSVLSFVNGEITQTFPAGNAKQIFIEGGVLDELGPIVAAEIARDGSSGTNGWLFVGGSGGVAVLSKANGSGWDTVTGLATGFSGLTAGMSFKKVGSYEHVRRLINDDQYLYVLTESQLDRIDLTQASVGLGILSATTIASATSFNEWPTVGSFLDVVVSEKLICLATSKGLYRLSNGLDARIVDTRSATWQLLTTPEDAGAIRQLVAITKTGRMQDLARTSDGGNVYALSAYRGKNRAAVYRFAVAQVVGSSITNSTVQRISDLYIKNIPSYFASYGLFKNLFATDGALFFGTESQHDDEHSVATILYATGGVQTGSRFLSNKEIPVDLNNSSLISAMIPTMATGSWLIAGDHGIRVNE